MLFKETEYRFCINCALAAEADEDTMICKKKGVVRKDGKCLSFTYDPLKRDPSRPRPLSFDRHDELDFSL